MSLTTPTATLQNKPSLPNDSTLDPPPSFQLPGLPPSLSESLTSGTSIPPPPPSPPPPPPPILPETPIKTNPQPPQQEASDPATPSMPGAFPTSPPRSPKADPQTPTAYLKSSYTASAYAGTQSLNGSQGGTPMSKSPKRPGGLRSLLSLKSFSRSPQNGTLDSPRYIPGTARSDSYRPASPGGSSMAPSFGLSLGKRSGGFWNRRKSSLGMYPEGLGQDPSHENGGVITHGQGTLYEDGKELKRPAEDMDGVQLLSPTLKKRNSTTFWRRKSSMGLNGGTGYFPPHGMNGTGTGNGSAMSGATKDVDGGVHSIDLQPVEDTRPRSPPPVIPEMEVMTEDGFMGSDDMFNHIG